MNRALGGMNRGPDERLKVYQRAKAKFSKLMAWNSDELAAMADTGSDDSQIRRTQILQALGELDGILSVLPPEVRGRVGGYTKLAGIAPMDVLKDGVKVSEVSGMVHQVAGQQVELVDLRREEVLEAQRCAAEQRAAAGQFDKLHRTLLV